MSNNFNTIIIVALTFYINSLNVIDAYECPISDGFFTDPEDPHYYYECIHNRAYHFECAGDLVFDVELKQCNWPTEGITRKPSTTTTTDTPGPTVTRTRHTDDTTTTEIFFSTEPSPDVTTQYWPINSTTQQSTTPTTVTTDITREESTRGRHETSTA